MEKMCQLVLKGDCTLFASQAFLARDKKTRLKKISAFILFHELWLHIGRHINRSLLHGYL